MEDYLRISFPSSLTVTVKEIPELSFHTFRFLFGEAQQYFVSMYLYP